MKNAFKIILLGALAGFGGAFLFYIGFIKPELAQRQSEARFNTVSYDSPATTSPATPSYSTSPTTAVTPIDFSDAAAKATQSVVYINSISRGATYSTWDWFF